MSQWISVKDRLPENDPNIKKRIRERNHGFITVLGYNGEVNPMIRFFWNKPKLGLKKTEGWVWGEKKVTHWMPLPEPPGKEDK